MTETPTLRDAGFVPARVGGLTATITGDARGQWLVLSESDDLDAAQVSGRWIKTTDAGEVKR